MLYHHCLSSQVPFLLLLLICGCVVCMHVTIQGHTMHTPIEARAGWGISLDVSLMS